MNRKLILKYFEQSLVMNVAVDDKEEDTAGDRLDRIWYHKFTENERRLVQLLLNEAYRSGEKVTPKHAITQIIAKLQDKPIMMNVFENKVDYLKLRDFWKTFHAEKKYAAVPKEFTRFDYSQRKSVVAGYHMVSPLEFRHHLVYLAAVGRDLKKGTTGMQLSTIEGIRHDLNFVRNRPADLKKYWFELFGDAIDEKYYGVIADCIKDFFDGQYESFKANGGKRP